MHEQNSYDYAIIRVVPYVERGEFINVGIILFCRKKQFLATRILLDEDRLLALAPKCNITLIKAQLALFSRISTGEGPFGKMSLAERFHWLVAPRSTVIQISEVHCGACIDPAIVLDELVEKMVKV